MKKRILIIVIILVEIIQLSLIGLLIYGRIGYKPYGDTKRKEIVKYTYVMGSNEYEFEYELPEDIYSELFTYVKSFTLYIPYDMVAFMYELTYGGFEGGLRFHLDNGEYHTIEPVTGRKLFGRQMFIIHIDNEKAYLTDAWYGISLGRLLSSYRDEWKAARKASGKFR